jgi:hypothetical protein
VLSVLQRRAYSVGGLIVQGLVGSVVVVLGPPVVDQQLGFVQGVEAFHVQQLPAEVALNCERQR